MEIIRLNDPSKLVFCFTGGDKDPIVKLNCKRMMQIAEIFEIEVKKGSFELDSSKIHVWFGDKIDEHYKARESLFTQKSVFVVDSYTAKDREAFLEDIFKANALPTTLQSLIFELLKDSSSKKFKACLKVIKEAPEWNGQQPRL